MLIGRQRIQVCRNGNQYVITNHPGLSLRSRADCNYTSELILSVILESLVFTPGTNKTYWNMSNTYSPTVEGSEDISPRLLLNVSPVEA